jgi:hypothetical protein
MPPRFPCLRSPPQRHWWLAPGTNVWSCTRHAGNTRELYSTHREGVWGWVEERLQKARGGGGCGRAEEEGYLVGSAGPNCRAVPSLRCVPVGILHSNFSTGLPRKTTTPNARQQNLNHTGPTHYRPRQRTRVSGTHQALRVVKVVHLGLALRVLDARGSNEVEVELDVTLMLLLAPLGHGPVHPPPQKQQMITAGNDGSTWGRLGGGGGGRLEGERARHDGSGSARRREQSCWR